MMSECCNAKTFKARSASGWYINGILTHEWHECSQCKQACDTLSPILDQSQKEIENDEQDDSKGICDRTHGATRQDSANPICEKT